MDAARALLQLARDGAAFAFRPNFRLGPEGRGWLARGEAEFQRARGENDPAAWHAVLAEFGPYHPTRSPAPGGGSPRRSRRPATAPGLRSSGGWPPAPGGGSPRRSRTGDRPGAEEQWRLAARTADQLRAAPLRAALDDLARRARRAHLSGTVALVRPNRNGQRGTASAGTASAGTASAGTASAGGGQRGGGTAPNLAILTARSARSSPDRGGAQQPGDRRGAVHLGQDGQRARVQHPRQAGRREPDRGAAVTLRDARRAARDGAGRAPSLTDRRERGHYLRGPRDGRRVLHIRGPDAGNQFRS